MVGGSKVVPPPPPPVFETEYVRIVCTSDTHGEDATDDIPPGDILIHAGDLTEHGSLAELRQALAWLSALPHPVKVLIAGNHDLGLDQSHHAYSKEALELFTSARTRAQRIHYLDSETQTIAYQRVSRGKAVPIKVYGNANTPDFLQSDYAFTYEPAPSESADTAWATAPPSFRQNGDDPVAIHVTHGAPLDHLDKLPASNVSGCAEQEQMVRRTRPVLCVYGHFHDSRGWETVRWGGEGGRSSDEMYVVEAQHRKHREGDELLIVDAAGSKGQRTTFVNAAWMTHAKRETNRRNQPIVVDLKLV